MKLTSCPRQGTAGHGGASAGRGATAGHSPKPASRPGASPAPPPCPPPKAQPGSRVTPAPHPPLPCPHGVTHGPRAARPGHSARYAARARAVLSPTTVGASGASLSPSPPNGPRRCPIESVWGFVSFRFVLFGSRRPDAGLRPVPALPGEGAPGGPREVAEGRHFPHAHSLRDCLFNSWFGESSVFLG